MPAATVNGVKLHFEECSSPTSKEPLLMIMGLTFSLLDWGQDLPSELSKLYRVILFDNRASGQSEIPSGPFTVSDMANDAAALLRELKITRSHVFGISMGGMIAQELALTNPALVDKLVLGCTACRATMSPDALATFTGQSSGDPPIWSALFSPGFIKASRSSLETFWKKVEPLHSKGVALDLQMQAVGGHDACSRLPKLAAETLILTGDTDPLIVPSNSTMLKSLIPKSKLQEPIKDARHGFPYSHWKETLAALTDFLK